MATSEQVVKFLNEQIELNTGMGNINLVKPYEEARALIRDLEKRVKSLDKSVVEEIENRDHWEERASKLAYAVGEHFSESVGEHSSANCPINNAHELLNQI
ncbi:hypothetical protein [Shewanella colwelliana]|uniref:hypothetical protein n=1 Tax=Shewanella colwelliana TaxID=23 RepID=UPI0022B02FBA|nr:hypothetical protein [Shewanella colwelliana]MCZ4337825.1 hypothetical protein [Shewanella colwelliana]